MSQPTAGLAFELLERERVVVSYAGPHANRQDEWDRYIELMQARTDASMRFLVLHDGSAPTVRDQQRIGSIARPHRPLVALVSSSNALRFVASAFSLINRRIRFFAPDDMDAALSHLELRDWEKQSVLECVDRLKAMAAP
ncbi:MAG: hypothetical protein ABW252_22265 [Polyangiales bacterium]